MYFFTTFYLNKTAAEAHRLISETVTADRYQQLYQLNNELMRKRPVIDVK